MHELYTMAEMANILKTPESTVRSHCHRFEEYVPHTGQGREKRYLTEALTVLRVVADCYGRNMTTTQIREYLAREFPRTISADDPQQQSTTSQQQEAAEQQQLLLTQQQAAAMMLMVAAGYQQVSGELKEIKEKLASIEEQQSISTEEVKKKVEWAVVKLEQKNNRSFWKRLFGR